MDAVRIITGTAVPLDRSDVDTDQIIPSDWLKQVERTGFDKGLFSEWRDDRDFVLNQEQFQGANILIAGPNFGTGSSREHAVWSLQQFGIRAVIASSYAEIFYSNAMNNRLLLVTLPPETIEKLMVDAEDPAGNAIEIDITSQTLKSRSVQAGFELMPRHRKMFLEGLDSIGLSLTYQDQIAAFADAHWARQPWVRDVAATTKRRL